MKMSEPQIKSPEGEEVFRPATRAFLVYYVAIFLVVGGPLINPALGLPLWLGLILGALLVAAVAYMKWGQEYRLGSRGVSKVWKVPARRWDIPWDNLGEVVVLRGMTQTVLKVGVLVLKDNTGAQDMIWWGLGEPHKVKDRIEARRPGA